MTLPKLKQRGYVNYGDINPRRHGGMFIKDLGDSLRIVETLHIPSHCAQLAKEQGKYRIAVVEVDKAELMADTGLDSFTGGDESRDMFDSEEDFQADKMIRLASGYLAYRQGDDVEYVDNYYAGLRRFGVWGWS